MEIITNVIRGVKRNAKIIEEEFSEIFALPEESLDGYEGNLEEVALAHVVMRMKRNGYVCPSCKSEAFASLRKTIMDADVNIKSNQPTTSEGDQDEGENQDDDTSDKCG